MTRVFACLVGGALLIGGAGLLIAQAQQPGAVLIAGDRPVTSEEVEAKLKAYGWSNIIISRQGRYMQVVGLVNGKPDKITVDPQNGRVRASDDDDDD
jgi:hypothetical protein